MKTMKITTLEQIKKISQGEIVELPSFVGGEPFVVRLKRPSLLGLASSGKIPNALLPIADEIFNGKFQDPKLSKGNGFKELAEVFEIVAENALAEPTFYEIKELGISLTDEQLMTIFNYTQMGIKAVIPFRSQADNHEDNQSEQSV